jgi:undecaprenyl diphosphate synthase
MRGLERAEGHRQGAKKVLPLIGKVRECGIGCLSFYALSTENFDREAAEVSALQDTMQRFLEASILPFATQNSIRLSFLGRRDRINDGFARLMRVAEEETADNDGLKVNFAVDYGGRDEIARALNHCRHTDKELYCYKDIEKYFYTADLPDPDVMLRYGGYKRLSNFMPLQCAYAELMFTEKLWPDFDPCDIDEVIRNYEKIKRNFGKV